MYAINNIDGILVTPENPKYAPKSKGFGLHCFNKCKEHRHKIAQTNADTNESQTYEEILRDSIRVALHMQSLGINETNIISICSTTHSQLCIPYWATIFLNAKMANLDVTFTTSRMKYLINVIHPRLIFCTQDSVSSLEEALIDADFECNLIVFGKSVETKHYKFDNFIKPHPNEHIFQPKTVTDLFDTAIILFSSGTTGLPKPVQLTHYGILEVLEILIDYFDWTSMLFYTSPCGVAYLLFASATLLYGGRRLYCERFNENNCVEIIQDYKVTNVYIPPSFTYLVTAVPENYNYDTSSLKTQIIGGSNVSKEHIKKLNQLFPHAAIINMYGLTETTAFITTFNPKEDKELFEDKVNCCGRLLPGVKCKIVDFEKNKLIKGPNKSGEILIKCKRNMKGYLNNDEANRTTFDEDGFIHTGDVGYYDEDYCFYITDRIKDIFKCKYWHIIPTELENILLQHCAVKEAVVIGIPNEEDGEHPMAVITLNNGTNVTENDVLNYFNEQVSNQKKLRAGVKFMKSLPKTATGKYNRVALRKFIINNEN